MNDFMSKNDKKNHDSLLEEKTFIEKKSCVKIRLGFNKKELCLI